MKSRFFLALCCVLFWSADARAEVDNEVKRGLFPFMAMVYYPDETVVDSTGARFQRAAVLIKPNWLLSSAIDHSVLDNVPLGFPRKTLLARAGAVTLDGNYTLNEDEDEQEREIIQVVRPNIHNPEAWWFTDITLLQTLLPFKLTSAVATTNISPKKEYNDRNCVILVFARKYGNMTEEKILMQLGVELLPPSIDNCGTQFSDTTMTCAADSEETKNAVFDPDFCQGNSGGPLMCEGEVMALQTYIENNCKQPHLYQLLTSWETFINCGVEEKCNKEENCNVCVVTNKDMPVKTETGTPTTFTTLISNTTATTTILTETTPEETETEQPKQSLPTTAPETEPPQTEPPTTNNEYSPTTVEQTETQTVPDTTTETSTEKSTITRSVSPHSRPWPVERQSEESKESKRLEQSQDLARTTKVEAQMQQMRAPPEPVRTYHQMNSPTSSGQILMLELMLIPFTLAYLL